MQSVKLQENSSLVNLKKNQNYQIIYVKCIGDNTVAEFCLNQHCLQKNAFICRDENCQCNNIHECCLKGNIKFTLKRIKTKLINTEQLKININQIFSNVINKINEFEQQLIQNIETNLKFANLFDLQKKFYDFLTNPKKSLNQQFHAQNRIKLWEKINFHPLNQKLIFDDYFNLLKQYEKSCFNQIKKSQKQISEKIKGFTFSNKPSDQQFGNSNITNPVKNDENEIKQTLQQFLQSKEDQFIKIKNNQFFKNRSQNQIGPAQYQIQFDSDGELFDYKQKQEDIQNQNSEIIKIKQILKVNYTEQQKYKAKDQVYCQFCNKSNIDINAIKKCGPFYGPFQKRKNKYFVHFLCAIWCYKVYLNDNNRLMGVQDSVQIASKKRCIFCEKYGAGLICENCHKPMHYECVINKCQFTYKLKCNDCLYQQKQQQLNSQKISQKKVKLQQQLQCNNLKSLNNFKNRELIPIQKDYQRYDFIDISKKDFRKQTYNMMEIENNQQINSPIKNIQNSEISQLQFKNTINLNKVKLQDSEKKKINIDPKIIMFDISSQSYQIIESSQQNVKNKTKIIFKKNSNFNKIQPSNKRKKGRPRKSNQ